MPIAMTTQLIERIIQKGGFSVFSLRGTIDTEGDARKNIA